MFDWDRDYEDVVRKNKIRRSTIPDADAPVESRWYWRGLMTRIVLPVVALVMLGTAGYVAQHLAGSATATSRISAAVFNPSLARPSSIAMPANLVVYDQAGFDRFVASMARINDGDLVQYALNTQRDLGGGDGVMSPYLRDVLTLTHLEMERRGLAQPVTASAEPALVTVPLADSTAPAPQTHRAALILQAAAPLIETE